MKILNSWQSSKSFALALRLPPKECTAIFFADSEIQASYHHKCLQNELRIQMQLLWYEVLSLLCRFPLLVFSDQKLEKANPRLTSIWPPSPPFQPAMLLKPLTSTSPLKGSTLHSSHIVGHVEAFEEQYLIFLMELLELILQIKQRLSWNACRLTSPRYPQLFINLFLPSSCTAVPWPVLANSYKANGVFYQASQEAYIPLKNLASYLRCRGE